MPKKNWPDQKPKASGTYKATFRDNTTQDVAYDAETGLWAVELPYEVFNLLSFEDSEAEPEAEQTETPA